MRKEKLQWIRFEPLDQNSTLLIHLDGGGAKAEFVIGESAESVIYELRYLADMLERGIRERAK